MEIETAQKMKVYLETVIAREIDAFHERTGLMVDSIVVDQTLYPTDGRPMLDKGIHVRWMAEVDVKAFIYGLPTMTNPIQNIVDKLERCKADGHAAGAPGLIPEHCFDCLAEPGQPHRDGCDIERCSVCGGQRIQCGCEGHDRAFARWTGIWPGAAESGAMNIDLNEFHRLGLHRIFFVKPGAKETPSDAAHGFGGCHDADGGGIGRSRGFADR